MGNSNPNDKKSYQKIKFSFHAPQADEVLLVGDFNNWNQKKNSMKKSKQGTWEKVLQLTPGSYEYKYVVDGNWQEDPESSQNCLNAFGSYNSVLTVNE